MMPNKDGWQVIEEIKSYPELSTIPIIICSITEDREKAYQLGAVDYLVKPILEEELVTAVKNLSFNTERTVYDILVIDDDPDVLQLIKATLRDEPTYRLQYANGGFSGLELMKERKPDALILDLIMPDLDGFSILETMQGDSDLRTIPVIILTAADLTIEERMQIERYKRSFLQKTTFRRDDLIDFLENALDKIENESEG
jgi:CheY-like chemotaxis protein